MRQAIEEEQKKLQQLLLLQQQQQLQIQQQLQLQQHHLINPTIFKPAPVEGSHLIINNIGCCAYIIIIINSRVF